MGWLRARGRMFHCWLLMGLLSACAGGPVDKDKLPASQLAYPSSTSSHPINATKAKVSVGGQLRISYLDGDLEIPVSGDLLAPVSTDPSLRELIPPIIHFQALQAGPADQTAPGTTVSIRPVEAWRELIYQLEREIAALVPGQGEHATEPNTSKKKKKTIKINELPRQLCRAAKRRGTGNRTVVIII